MNLHRVIFSLRIFSFITYCSVLVLPISADDILGCGGFVKSQVDINFSEIEVKLYTKHGALKDQTDCAPNNGYYFLPLYDKGEYILKIDPPTGWQFEPFEVNLNVDGSTDLCSKGIDINFAFKGFSIFGKVVSAGSTIGPKGVKIALHSDTTSKPIQEVLTSMDGDFTFAAILQGKYEIVASHPCWKFSKNTTSVHLVEGNVHIGVGELVVAGYDVSGLVTSEEEPFEGVSFVLFHTDMVHSQLTSNYIGCDSKSLKGFKTNDIPICHVTSDEKGIFRFHSLPPGRYKAVPHYEGPHSINFDVKPQEMEFTVDHDSLMIDTKFEVKGFSVRGRVAMHPDGPGLEGASILLDGYLKSYTQADGVFLLENMQPGTFTLQIQASDVKFNTANIKITANEFNLQDFYPSSFKICGHVASHQTKQNTISKTARVLSIHKVGSSELIEVKSDPVVGEFCHFLEVGQYEIAVKVSEKEKNMGLQFHPLVKNITVVDGPILSGIEFIQLKVQVLGKIANLPKSGNVFPNIPVTLKMIQYDQTEEIVTLLKTHAKDGAYSFDNILPGKYEVTVEKIEWCWESTSYIIDVNSLESTVPIFVQTGFTVTFVSSHDTEVLYNLQKSHDIDQSSHKIFVKSGITKVCVSKAGVYEFKPLGCHGYTQPVFHWNSAAMPVSPVKLTAISHTVGGHVISSENVSDIYITVVFGENKKIKTRLGPLKAESLPDKQFFYHFALLLNEGEKVIFEPSSNTLLFSPANMQFFGIHECLEKAVAFKADYGKIIEGKIFPPLAGVEITIENENTSERVSVTETNHNGTYRVGPLLGGINYRLTAEKKGYVLSKPDSNGNFNAHKLAELIVEVLDKATNSPLQGVLLSLSGEDSFRRNSQTGQAGNMTFSSLSPGEYFLRPMLKEYRFEPPSKIITIEEGSTILVKLFGLRVAHSAYGIVTSLSGEPEENIVVEAVGLDSCAHFQEESTTDEKGYFRIRGLQPQCEYLIGMKKGQETNRVYSVSQSSIKIKAEKNDVTGLRLIAFHPINQMDISAYIQASSQEHLKTLCVKLFLEDAPEYPIHTIKMDMITGKSLTNTNNAGLILFPSIPVDGRGYFLLLDSSLPYSTHIYTTQTLHFKATCPFKHFKLFFASQSKHIEQDIGHSSYLAVPLIIIFGLVYLYQQKIFPLLNKFAQTLNNVVATGPSSGRPGNNESDHGNADVVLVEPVLNIRRKLKPRKTQFS